MKGNYRDFGVLEDDDNDIVNEKKKIWVSMKGQCFQKCLMLQERQLKNLLTLKKRILNELLYEQSQTKKIQLHIMQVYPTQPQHIRTPIFNQQILKPIITFMLNNERDIRIQVQHIEEQGELINKEIISQEAIDKGELHFDENGSLIEEDDQMVENIPDNQKYRDGTGHVRCQFCQKNNLDTIYLKRCGGLYGPFEEDKYVHLLCALWCHKVFLDEFNMLRNVEEQIKRASKRKCKFCNEYGAGLACLGHRITKKNKTVKCYKNYHFKCAYDTGCTMNWLTFKMLCNTCNKNQQLFEQIQSGNQQAKDRRKNNQPSQIQIEDGIEPVKLEHEHPQYSISQKSKIKVESFH